MPVEKLMPNTHNLTSSRVSSALIVLWIACTLFSTLLPTHAMAQSVSLASLAAMVLFGLVHGARRFGARAILVFFVVAVIISNAYEDLSIVTGFPFGFYTHSPAMGPKLFLVPLIVGPSYFGGCYLAWTLANTLFGDPTRAVDRQYIFALPIIAAFIVVGWDLCQDPLGATVGQRWIYPHGGAFFGVPMSNFLGWFLVTWTIFQIFALYLTIARVQPRPVEPGYWYQASGFWAAIALQFPLLLLTMPETLVQDPSGWTWRSNDILQTATITGIYTMLATAVTSALVVAGRGNGSGRH